MAQALPELPAPVRQYLERIDESSGPGIRMQQRGELRTGLRTRRWMRFTASHFARGDRPEFHWRARVRLAAALSLTVVDRLEGGTGSGEVRFLGLRVACASGGLAMNAGSLHRYLAEAVWYPDALRPSDALRWAAKGDRSAVATLTAGGVSVSLEFRFDAAGDVVAVHTPARWGKFGREYREVPWEGHFGDYALVDGVRVPREAEVGWYDGGRLELVWKGRIEAIRRETGVTPRR
jgi:hypothetical protein